MDSKRESRYMLQESMPVSPVQLRVEMTVPARETGMVNETTHARHTVMVRMVSE